MSIRDILTARRRSDAQPRAVECDDNGVLYTSGGGGGPATIADGADVTQGALADAAVVTDVAGTISGKLRGLILWAFQRMPASLGQKLMAASLPVVLASDQSATPILVEDADGDQARVCPSMQALSTKRMSKCIDACEATAGWAGSTDVANIALSTNHRGPGVNSLEFDKTGATQAFATMTKTVAAVNGAAYSTRGMVEYYLYIDSAGDLGRITSVYMGLGPDNSNIWYWQTPVADLQVGWNHIHHPLSGVDGQLGNGANMGNIAFVILYVFLNAVGATLTDMKFDDIRLRFTDAVSLTDVHNHGNDDIVEVIQTTHDDLNCNANLQVANVDVGAGNPVPVGTELAAALALADGMANPTVPVVGAGEMLFNGTTWDRRRNNSEEVPFPSAARTGGSWVDSVNYNARGAFITLNVTAKTGSPSIHLEVWIWDPASNQRETLLVGGAVTAVGRHSYLVYPGCGPAANDIDTVAAYPLPRDWAVGMLHANADSITYSVGVMYIV